MVEQRILQVLLEDIPKNFICQCHSFEISQKVFKNTPTAKMYDWKIKVENKTIFHNNNKSRINILYNYFVNERLYFTMKLSNLVNNFFREVNNSVKNYLKID